MALRGPYKVVLRWLKFDRGGGVQQTQKLEPLQKSDNRLSPGRRTCEMDDIEDSCAFFSFYAAQGQVACKY